MPKRDIATVKPVIELVGQIMDAEGLDRNVILTIGQESFGIFISPAVLEFGGMELAIRALEEAASQLRSKQQVQVSAIPMMHHQGGNA